METQANYWQRSLHSSRVSRRRLLGGASAAGLGAAGLALVGCGDDGNGKATPGGGGTGTQAAGSPTAAQVKRDGIYRARQATPLATINPWGGLDTASTWGMYLPIYDRLIVTPGDTMVTENFLAEKIEVADPLHFTIKIKPAVFQNRPPVNGRAVTAEDIKGTMMGVQAAPKLPKDPWWNDVLDKVEVLDEKTVTFTLKKPDASTFYATKLAGPWHALVIPREHTADPSLMDKDLIGSGLFEFVSHQDGANLKVKRNETYREKDKGLPNLAALET